MKAIQLRSYQMKVIAAIKEALARNQKHIVVEIAEGCGKALVLNSNCRSTKQSSLEERCLHYFSQGLFDVSKVCHRGVLERTR